MIINKNFTRFDAARLQAAATNPSPADGATLAESAQPVEIGDIRQSLYAFLSNLSTLVAIFGEAIYPAVIPESIDFGASSGKALTFKVTSNVRSHNIQGPDGTATANVEFGFFSKTMADCVNGKKAVDAALDGLRGWMAGTWVLYAHQEDEDDDPEQLEDGSDSWLYLTSSVFVIKYRCKNN